MDWELGGGNMNSVRRIGNTVTRLAGPWTPTVHRYLTQLWDAGVTGVPRPLSIEGDREVLTFVEGEVPEYPLPDWVWADSALGEAATRLRALHDASTGSNSASAVWQSAAHAPFEVICHNDFAPHNLAFRDGHVVGVIDFDLCSPGPRVWDLAYLATRMVPLTTEPHEGAPGEDQWERRIQLMLDRYGSDLRVEEVILVAVERLRDLATFSRSKALEIGKAELNDHAALYDRDATYLEQTVPLG
ncbi:MAG TPA: aminoglycoside phosphotransferase family protein [Galbitalea sp.]|nr:aminoglycoside phosphotransferase family protein [Galbitalea sp.]